MHGPFTPEMIRTMPLPIGATTMLIKIMPVADPARSSFRANLYKRTQSYLIHRASDTFG